VGRRQFKRLVGGLKNLGYEVIWSVLDAADFAVPQRRRRLILLAGKGVRIPFGPKARTRPNVRDAIGELPHPRRSRDPHHRIGRMRSERIRRLIALIPKNGGSRRDLSRNYWLECHKKTDGFKDVYGRMRWSDVAPTITGGCVKPSKGRFLHPVQNRPITVREAALLQAFPKSYMFPTGKGAYSVAELVGNALPPEFVRRHAVEVRHVLANAQQGSHGSLVSARRACNSPDGYLRKLSMAPE
jgi:DNA (cytosine-5)-methyltransferase 1